MCDDYYTLDNVKSKKLITNKPEQRYYLVDETGKSILNNNKNGYTSREAAYKAYLQVKMPDVYRAFDLNEINEMIEHLCDRDEKEEENDISNPKHYKLEGLDIESIDVVKAVLGEEGFINFCLGNILKYAIRAKKKGQFYSDIAKIKTYSEFIERTKE